MVPRHTTLDIIADRVVPAPLRIGAILRTVVKLFGIFIPLVKNDDFPWGWWVYGIVLPALINSSYPLVMTNSLLLKMAIESSLIYPSKMVMLHSYVSLPEGYHDSPSDVVIFHQPYLGLLGDIMWYRICTPSDVHHHPHHPQHPHPHCHRRHHHHHQMEDDAHSPNQWQDWQIHQDPWKPADDQRRVAEGLGKMGIATSWWMAIYCHLSCCNHLVADFLLQSSQPQQSANWITSDLLGMLGRGAFTMFYQRNLWAATQISRKWMCIYLEALIECHLQEARSSSYPTCQNDSTRMSWCGGFEYVKAWGGNKTHPTRS